MLGAENVADLVKQHDCGLVTTSCLVRELALLGPQLSERFCVPLALLDVGVSPDDQMTPAQMSASQIFERGGEQRQRRRQAHDDEDVGSWILRREGLEVPGQRAAGDVALPRVVLRYQAKAVQR